MSTSRSQRVVTTPGTSSAARVRSAAVFVDPARVLPEMSTTYTGSPDLVIGVLPFPHWLLHCARRDSTGRGNDRLRKAYGGDPGSPAATFSNRVREGA